MDFTFGDLELSLRDTARAVMAAESPMEHVRAAWNAEVGRASRKAWDALASLGLLEALTPADSGGLGLDERGVVLVFEEAGRVALAEPLIETVVLGTLGGGPVGAGTMTAASTTLGRPGPGGGWEVGGGEGGPDSPPGATGTSTSLVPWGGDADALVLDGPDGWYLCDRGAVEAVPVPGVDGARRLARVTWAPAAAHLIDIAPVVRARALDGAALAAAAELVGLAQAMLDMTVAYVSGRTQFGAPVGSFQAVKHHLAGAATALEFARPVVHRAAWSLATSAPEAERDASMAKAMAGHAANGVGRACLQCHGAIGYTTEYDLHLYLKRAWVLARAWGDAAAHRARVGGWLEV